MTGVQTCALPIFLADEQFCERIFVNLIENAFQAMREQTSAPDGRTLTISTTAESSRGQEGVGIVFEDTGPGVPHAQIPLIFQEFTQLDASRTRRFEGAGMGLTIVQGLVKLFGGTVDVASTGRVIRAIADASNMPAKPPSPPSTSGRVARRTEAFMSSTALSPASTSTPAEA